MYFTLVMTGRELGSGPSRLLGGLAFSLGLILVVVGGAELFTGNNLIVMAWAERKVTRPAARTQLELGLPCQSGRGRWAAR